MPGHHRHGGGQCCFRSWMPSFPFHLPFWLPFLLLLGICTAEWAFLQDQSQCHLQCLNGGVCSFLVRRPEVHKCICLIGMYEGDRCQHLIEQNGSSSSSTVEPGEMAEEEEEDPAYEEEWKTAHKGGGNGEEEQEEGGGGGGGDEEEEEAEAEDELQEEASQKRQSAARAAAAAGGPAQTQRFLPEETNTLGTDLEHFAESRNRPVMALREENLEEPAVKEKGKKTKTKKGKKAKKPSKRPQKLTTEAPIVVEEEEEEYGRRDGWMLRRKGGGSGGEYSSRSSAGTTNSLALVILPILAIGICGRIGNEIGGGGII